VAANLQRRKNTMALELIPIITGDGTVTVVAVQDTEVVPRRRRAAVPDEMSLIPAATATPSTSDGSRPAAGSRRKGRSNR
jgi:hypothetical protein